MRFGVNSNWKGNVVRTFSGGSVVTVYCGGQIVCSFSYIEGITLGSDEEIPEVLRESCTSLDGRGDLLQATKGQVAEVHSTGMGVEDQGWF